MVQEFQKNILSSGEIAVMLFGGEYSHSVLKKAKKEISEYKTISEEVLKK